ncbi:hypothetical protein A1A1_13417 [Planococcus antarcticus DSM 14505]|uniref:DUF4085 domain-containing protein n=1 Tax=Planococcus antarcticus DSM 14505 TaxID=1185653 RepID=A0AA87IJP9_9BACL|nr:DUF4085 family protein [Planococcus antarcticus]EIM05946.1 hypothetical protein A1A1_13417 [Planococcus antarcticus DSM 14505]
MKYFTKDWYDEMQVSGFLALHESEEDWEEELHYYHKEGKDLRELNLRNLDDMRESLLRYLPETFLPYIHDGTLVTEYPAPELRMLVNRWERDYERRMEELSERYKQHFESIKAELPPTAVELVENGLHDAVVLSVERPSEVQLVLTLDCSGGFHYFTDVRFTFEGVTYSNVPTDFKGAWWLYDEIYKTEDGFELHTFFDSPMSETVIRARDVKIEPLKLPLMRRLKKWYRRR